MPARDGYHGGTLGAELLTVPGGKSPRKSSSRSSLSSSRPSANASPRQTSSLGQELNGADDDDDDESGAVNGHNNGHSNHRFSLAHELAAALMPDPNSSSRRLAEELGLEFDEGAEGIDEDDEETNQDEQDEHSLSARSASPQPLQNAKTPSPRVSSPPTPPEDPLVLLSRNVEATDVFLAQLRTLDNDATKKVSAEPPLERMTGDMIRRINDTAREREGQVRELVEYEREFKKIAGELGGIDILGELDVIENVDDLVDATTNPTTAQDWDRQEQSQPLHVVDEQEEDMDAENDFYDDQQQNDASPTKDAFPDPPEPSTGPATPSKALPHLAYMRTLTNSLVGSLTTISEHAQVNGAATADAGRKLRALKNKLGGWRADWESAEKSRIRIERWESGLVDNINDGDVSIPMGDDSPPLSAAPTRSAATRRIDARQIVQAELDAFAIVLQQAAIKTQAIMAAS